jgi:hypothetical protein
MTKAVFAVVALVFLAGCQTKTVEEMSYSERQSLAAQIQQRCYDQGVKPGSKEFVACSQVEVNAEAAKRRRQASIQDRIRSNPRIRANCQNFGGNIVCF